MCALHRRAPRRDANEALIFEAFRAAGCSILPISAAGAPDAVVFCHGRTYLVEVKSAKGKLRPAQVVFHQNWQGPEIHIVRTVDDALKLAKG